MILTGPLGRTCFELIELSSINKVNLVQVSSCSNTGSIRDDPYISIQLQRKTSSKELISYLLFPLCQ